MAVIRLALVESGSVEQPFARLRAPSIYSQNSAIFIAFNFPALRQFSLPFAPVPY